MLQVFGGNGFNSEYPVEKLMRDAKIYQVSSCIVLINCFHVLDIEKVMDLSIHNRISTCISFLHSLNAAWWWEEDLPCFVM
jgi:hypothetical protein